MDCFMDYDMDYWIQLCLKDRYTWLRDPQCNSMMSHLINNHMITDCTQIATVYIFTLYLDVNIMKTLHEYSCNVLEKYDHVNITVIILTLYLSISLVFEIICKEILLYSCLECLQYLMSFIKLKSKVMNPIEYIVNTIVTLYPPILVIDLLVLHCLDIFMELSFREYLIIIIDNTSIILWKHGEFIITRYNIFLLSDYFIIDRCLFFCFIIHEMVMYFMKLGYYSLSKLNINRSSRLYHPTYVFCHKYILFLSHIVLDIRSTSLKLNFELFRRTLIISPFPLHVFKFSEHGYVYMYCLILCFTLTFLATHIFFTRFILRVESFLNRLLLCLYINYRSAKLLISIRSLSKCDTCVLIEYLLFMTRATQNNTYMNINMYKNNMNSDYFKNIHCVNVINIIFFARVIVGINFKHSPNSEPKPLGAINIVAGNFRYLLVYIDHHHCRLSYKLNISSIVCSVCTAITLRVIIIPLCPIFNIYINFWYLKTSSKKIICRATSNSLFIQYLHSVTTLFALSYFRKQTLLWAHTFRFIVEVFSFIWCVYIYASTNPLTTNHYHWIHLRKMSKKELTLYPVHAEPICNFPFHSLNQRDFIDTCITDSTTNSRNSNVGVLIEGRTDYSILGNIDPDTHFLSSNNRVISNYYTENEFNQIPNLDKNFSIFNVNIRSIPKNFDRLRHYLLELNHNFSVI